MSARIVDVRGRTVRRLLTGETLAAGRHLVSWDGIGVESRPSPVGLYFLVVTAFGETRSAPVVLVH